MPDLLTLSSLRSGGKTALARALARIEAAPEADDTLNLLSDAFAAPRARVIGLTGPPGVGKSTLMQALIRAWRSAGRSVACIAVDPSSRRSGGALLGDRVRLATDPEDQGLFVRSMAARESLGGLAALTYPAMILMRALFDLVLIETVGIGQSETAVADVADTVLFCVQPASGDALQYMKAGIIEIPHIVAVTKGDMGAVARRARADVKAALALAASDHAAIPVLLVAARDGLGIAELVAAIDAHGERIATDGLRDAARHAQAQHWLRESLRERFGREGLRRLGPVELAAAESPFRRAARLARGPFAAGL